MLLLTVLLYFQRPTRRTGSADTRWPAATAADPDKKQTCHTAFINVAGSGGASLSFPWKTWPHNFPHRCGNPAALLVRSPGKPCHTTFITVVLVSVPEGPDDGSSQESFVLHRDQGTRQGTKQGTKQDSAPSGTQPLHFTLCFFGIISCDSAPCPDD